MVVVELPRRRAYMHLDTLFTPVDRELALVFLPVLIHTGSERATVYEVDMRSKHRSFEQRTDLLSCLAEPRGEVRAHRLRRRRRHRTAARAVDRRRQRAGAGPRRDRHVRPKPGDDGRAVRATASASSTRRIWCWGARRSISTPESACASPSRATSSHAREADLTVSRIRCSEILRGNDPPRANRKSGGFK